MSSTSRREKDGHLLKTLQSAAGTTLINEDGVREELRLLPGPNEDELRAVISAIPCPLPDEMQEVFAATRGFEGGAHETVDFSGLPGGLGSKRFFPRQSPLQQTDSEIIGLWT